MNTTLIATFRPKEDDGAVLIAVNGVTIGLGVALVSLRVYVRTRMKNNFGWDDFFIILALVRSVA